MSKSLKLDLTHLNIPLSIVFLVFIYLFRAQAALEFEILVMAALFYLLIAFLHHHNDKSLTFEVIIEYILIAALALIILQGVLV